MTFETLQKEMISAMKNKDKTRKDTISTLVATAKNIAIAKKQKDNIDETIVGEAILKELKTVNEQIETCPNDRVELLNEYKMRKAIIEEFAPKMLTREEIKELVSTKFANVLATKNKGMIMKTIMPELKGKADGKLINEVIAEMM